MLASASWNADVDSALVDVPDSTAVSSTSSATSAGSAALVTSSPGSVTSQVTGSTPSSTGVVRATNTSNTGLIIGGIVGGVLGPLLIGAIVFSILLRHRRPSRAARDEAGPAVSSVPRNGTLYGHSPILKDQTPPADSMVYVGINQSDFVRSRAHYRRQDRRTRMIRGHSRLIARSSGAWACLTRRWADIRKSRPSCRAMHQVWDTERSELDI